MHGDKGEEEVDESQEESGGSEVAGSLATPSSDSVEEAEGVIVCVHVFCTYIYIRTLVCLYMCTRCN